MMILEFDDKIFWYFWSNLMKMNRNAWFDGIIQIICRLWIILFTTNPSKRSLSIWCFELLHVFGIKWAFEKQEMNHVMGIF
jgi:hypothetical protein